MFGMESKKQRVSPFREVRVWDGSGGGSIHFDSANLAEADMGHIIENRVMQKALMDRLAHFENIDFISPVSLKKMNDNKIELDNGEIISAQLIVGADGARSWVREQAGIAVKERPYGHHALVAKVQTEIPHQKTAWQRFLPKGTLAFLPLEDENYCSIVWAESPERVEELKNSDEDLFKKELAEQFESRLGRIKSIGQRATFPLQMRHAKNYVLPGIALIGDAAHTIHPLAGQGLNLGIADAQVLADVIKEALKKKRDFAGLPILRKYERGRKSDNLTMIAAMDGFKYLFGSQSEPAKWIRKTGLNLTNAFNPVKNIIMERILGL